MDNKSKYVLIKQSNIFRKLLSGGTNYGKGLKKDIGSIGRIAKPGAGQTRLGNVRAAFTPTRTMSKYNPINRLTSPETYNATSSGAKNFLGALNYGSGGMWKSPVGRASKLYGSYVLGDQAYKGYDQLDENIAQGIQNTFVDPSGNPYFNDGLTEDLRSGIDANKFSLLKQLVNPSYWDTPFADTSPEGKAISEQNRKALSMFNEGIRSKEQPFDVSSRTYLGHAARGPVAPFVVGGAQALANKAIGGTAAPGGDIDCLLYTSDAADE